MSGKFFAVAIDGPSGAGKSTLAREAARELGFRYLDTGSIYRTVAYGAAVEGVDLDDTKAVEQLLSAMELTLNYDDSGLQRMFLNGEDVTAHLHTPELSLLASKLSALPAVRAFLLEMQRGVARQFSVIMDGRDIGTVVLPQADVKIFLTASPEERAKRRKRQLWDEKGIDKDYHELLAEIKQRDYNDANRAIAPLRPAEDAKVMDTTGISFAESRNRILAVIREKLNP